MSYPKDRAYCIQTYDDMLYQLYVELNKKCMVLYAEKHVLNKPRVTSKWMEVQAVVKDHKD